MDAGTNRSWALDCLSTIRCDGEEFPKTLEPAMPPFGRFGDHESRHMWRVPVLPWEQSERNSSPKTQSRKTTRGVIFGL